MNDRPKSIKPCSRWYLYILLCRDRTLYTGITNNLSRRLKMHNGGKASRYTRGRLPVRLIYQEPTGGRSNALRKEHAIKRLSRAEKEEYIRKKSKKTETKTGHLKLKANS